MRVVNLLIFEQNVDIGDNISLMEDVLEIEDSNLVLYMIIVESQDADKPAPFVLTVDCGP